eukprot:Phypoly_transcript_22341.p1 GENE.Phypoly_transcript_22341~~Phypoly_transcript_22341.p1  ORF type:complete len:127 (-),score=21.67 Phypoly_transcript_22341:109-489(-)
MVVQQPGAKAQPPETIEQAAIRECIEETNITPTKLISRGVIEFTFENQASWDNCCHIFTCTEFTGEPQETEEMLPSWYDVKNIPYDQMWDDDEIWIPELLRGDSINYHFKFSSEGKMLSYNKLPAA